MVAFGPATINNAQSVVGISTQNPGNNFVGEIINKLSIINSISTNDILLFNKFLLLINTSIEPIKNSQNLDWGK
jgi:hypothetical protein